MQKNISGSYNRAFTCLKEIGYKPLKSDEVKHPFQENILRQRILSHQSFYYRGKENKFSSYSTERAFLKLKHAVASHYNEMYVLLRNGITTTETIDSETINSTIHYIDWEDLKNNQFHIARGYTFDVGTKHFTLDMVLFVNGIPLVILDFSLLGSALFQKLQLLNDELASGNTPISFAQLLISVSPEIVEYNTTNADNNQWLTWNEDVEDSLEHRQDVILTELCAPENLLLLIKNYILVSNDNKMIARQHQRRAVECTIERIRVHNPDGTRRGGTILQAVGTGITTTKTLLIQNIMQQTDIIKPRILVVTDRLAINEQIQHFFSKYGLDSIRATSVEHLMKLLQDDSPVITTVINKFHRIPIDETDRNNTSELFILIDETHGKLSGTFSHNLHQLFPQACYIGFTSTPFLLGKDIYEQNQLIDLHSIADSIKNDVTVPIFYFNNSPGTSFDIALDPEFSGPWKRSRQSFDEDNVEIIAGDITKHFCKHNKGTSFKAILVAPSRPAAQKYKKYFDKLKNGPDPINTAILVSKEDLNIQHNMPFIDDFTEQYIYLEGKNEEEYNNDTIQNLQSSSNELEILIICNQRLTGVDTSLVNTLYIAKYMQSNMLMRYISMINRKTKNKFNCHVIDYVDIQQSFDDAMNAWQKISKIPYGLHQPYTQKYQLFRLINGFRILDQLRDLIEKPATNLKALHSLIPQKELKELYLLKLYECNSILSNTKIESEEIKKDIDKQHFHERLDIHKKFSKEITYSDDTQSEILLNNQIPEPQVDTVVPNMLHNDWLAISFYKTFKASLIKKEAGISDEKIASSCILWANEIRAMVVRDWKKNSKVIRGMTNYLEDSLLLLYDENKTEIDFSEIDGLLDGFLTAIKDQFNE